MATVMFGVLLVRVADPYSLMAAFHLLYLFAITLSALCGVTGLMAGLALLSGRRSSRGLALIAALLSLSELPVGITLGEVTALKVGSIDFKRKLLRVTGALDYATRKESTPKSNNSAAPVHMSELLATHLRDWLDKHYKPNVNGYLFTNSKDRPYLSDNVVKYGVHRAMAKLGVKTPKGVHVGINCFRHGVTSELLESGTPIHVVTRLMRHADSGVTLEHYAHIVGDAERIASEKFSQRIGQHLTQLESDPELESTSSIKTA
jgi:integrase